MTNEQEAETLNTQLRLDLERLCEEVGPEKFFKAVDELRTAISSTSPKEAD